MDVILLGNDDIVGRTDRVGVQVFGDPDETLLGILVGCNDIDGKPLLESAEGTSLDDRAEGCIEIDGVSLLGKAVKLLGI